MKNMFSRQFVVFVCLVCIFTCQATTRCFAKQFETSNDAVLNVFLRTLFENAEAGYVMSNQKPMCYLRYSKKDFFSPTTSGHRFSVALKKGASIWKQTAPKNNDILICICDKDPYADGGYLLVVNRPLLLQTIQNNLMLFQYVLGPTVTPESLVQSLTDPAKTLYSALKDDRILVGIVLGYGVENAIYESRFENIQEAFLYPDNPPFRSHFSQLPHSLSSFKEAYLFLPLSLNTSEKRLELIPSSGFSSISEEL